jgi:Histidine kinase-, DNA gyrase B-, and HSP90-like ATPase
VVAHSRDEVGQMALSFNKLQEEIGRAASGKEGARTGPDLPRLKQLLLNLLSNAVKYNREGGNITLTAGETSHGTLRLTVGDTGEGITSPGIEKLFTPFERLRAPDIATEGIGLGLAISKRIIELMGGEIGGNVTGCGYLRDYQRTGNASGGFSLRKQKRRSSYSRRREALPVACRSPACAHLGEVSRSTIALTNSAKALRCASLYSALLVTLDQRRWKAPSFSARLPNLSPLLFNGDEPRRRSGLAKQKTLRKVDADFTQRSQRPLHLHEFRYALDFQPMSDVVHHLHKDPFAVIVLGVLNKTPVDFQVIRDEIS